MRIVRSWDTAANAARYGVVEGGAVREIGLAISKAPVLFLKPPSSLIGHLEPIQYPRETWRLESEGELTVPRGAGQAGTRSSAWMAELPEDVEHRRMGHSGPVQWARGRDPRLADRFSAGGAKLQRRSS